MKKLSQGIKNGKNSNSICGEKTKLCETMYMISALTILFSVRNE